MPRVQHCTLCKNHKRKVLKKGHEPCPFSNCNCKFCDLSKRSRKVMCHQQRLWRFKKDKISKLKKAGKITEDEPKDGSGTKTQYCDRCRNHNQLKKKKKHNCPHANCMCKFCKLNFVRRTQMMHQQKVRRSDNQWNSENSTFEPVISLVRSPHSDCSKPEEDLSNQSYEDSASRERMPSPHTSDHSDLKESFQECLRFSDRYISEESRTRLMACDEPQKENYFDHRKLHQLKHPSPLGGIIELFENKIEMKDDLKTESHHRQLFEINQRSAFSSIRPKKSSLHIDSLRAVNCPQAILKLEDRAPTHFDPKESSLPFNRLSVPAGMFAHSLRLPVPPPTIIHHPRPLLGYSSYSHRWAHMMLPTAANYNFEAATYRWFDSQDFWPKPPNY